MTCLQFPTLRLELAAAAVLRHSRSRRQKRFILTPVSVSISKFRPEPAGTKSSITNNSRDSDCRSGIHKSTDRRDSVMDDHGGAWAFSRTAGRAETAHSKLQNTEVSNFLFRSGGAGLGLHTQQPLRWGVRTPSTDGGRIRARAAKFPIHVGHDRGCLHSNTPDLGRSGREVQRRSALLLPFRFLHPLPARDCDRRALLPCP